MPTFIYQKISAVSVFCVFSHDSLPDFLYTLLESPRFGEAVLVRLVYVLEISHLFFFETGIYSGVYAQRNLSECRQYVNSPKAAMVFTPSREMLSFTSSFIICNPL